MNRNKLITFAIVGELLLLCALFSAITFSLEDPTTQLSLAAQQVQVSPTGSNIQTVNGPTPSFTLCQGFADDRAYLYQLDTTITTKPDGTKTFVSKRLGDNKILRQTFANEKFYVDKSSGGIRTTYDITSQCGGVDIKYTVTNNSSTAQPLPDFEIDGIMQRTTGDFYVVDTKDAGFIRNVKDSSGNPPDMLYGGGCCHYPGFYYSPLMISHDGDFAVGSALLYPYLQYRHTVAPEITKITSSSDVQVGTWRHKYRDLKNEISGANPNPNLTNATLARGETRTYTVSLRFTEPRSWILTQDPYKKFFKSTYGNNVDQVRPQSQKPVEAEIMAQDVNRNAQNPRGYANLGILSNGWVSFIDSYISGMQTRGFDRTMIWSPSGQYSLLYSSPGGSCANCNYPMHFMSFLPHLEATADYFTEFAQNDIELGFWWGNSGHIPVPNQWDPVTNRLADYANAADRAFLDNQLLLAYNRGARTIGLDAFSGATYDKYTWIDHLKQITNNQVLFVQEHSGPDIMHRKIANFYHPYLSSYPWWNQYPKDAMYGPDVLSRYLNAGAEIWMQHDVVPPFCNRDLYEKSYSWGFTPLIAHCPSLRVSSLDLEVVGCFDGVDNDGDGASDWPYDRGCSSALDDDETVNSGNNSPMFSEAGEDAGDSSGGGDNTGGDGRGGGRNNNNESSRESLLRRIQELQALLTALQNQLSGMGTNTGGVSGTAVANITRNLTIGSKGADVALLQKYLVAKGVLVMPARATYGTFGPLTKLALARFQKAKGISPAVGYFGPVTRAKIRLIP